MNFKIPGKNSTWGSPILQQDGDGGAGGAPKGIGNEKSILEQKSSGEQVKGLENS